MGTSKSTRIAIVTVLIGVLAAGLLVAIGVLVTPTSASASEQVFLEPATDVGQSPFVPAAGVKNPALPNGSDAVGSQGAQCDGSALISALEGDVRLARAWAEALNTDATLKWSG